MNDQAKAQAGAAAAGGAAGKQDGAADAGPGSATDAIAAFGSALVKAAGAKPDNTADANVSAAFALGWQMAELYRPHPREPIRYSWPSRRRPEPLDKDLPGLGSIGDDQRVGILVDQIQAAVNKLKDPIAQAGLDALDLTALKASVGKDDRLPAAVFALHLKLQGELTAADFRLGKAYGLGRALADTCREPVDLEGARSQLQPYRIANLLRWLDDLSSAFPPHAAHSVASSLMRWREELDPTGPRSEPAQQGGWAKWRREAAVTWQQRGGRAETTGPRDTTGAGHQATAGHASAPPQAPPSDDTVRTLRRQGELWRALLSGEKQGTEMLEIDNYLDATREVATRMGAVARGVVARLPVLTLAIGALLIAGVVLVIIGGSTQLVAGAASLVAALGLTWKGIGGALGQLAGKLEQPLWGAVLDDAITEAITLLPGNKADKRGRRAVALALPAPGARQATTQQLGSTEPGTGGEGEPGEPEPEGKI
jgi:hypothetical protein